MYIIATRNYPPEVGGMQNLMYGLSVSLSKYEMIKVFADKHRNQKDFDNNLSFSIERTGGPKLFKSFRKAGLINDYLKKNNKVKGIIADHWKSLEKITSNLKKICLIHSKEINHEKGSYLNQRSIKVLNQCAYVVANSNFTKNLAISRGVNENKIKVIHPGILDTKQINTKILKGIEKKIKDMTPRLITISRFDKRKNHEKIIMCVRNLKELYPKLIYFCIGSGEEEENLKKIVKELQIDKHVIFLKNLSLDQQNSYLKNSDIFVMPSIKHKKSVEGFGIAYMEAAQFGVPSIGGKDGGASDAFNHNETGLICDGNNFEDIYEAITKMLENKKHKVFGNQAKINSKRFYWSKIIKQYLDIL